MGQLSNLADNIIYKHTNMTYTFGHCIKKPRAFDFILRPL